MKKTQLFKQKTRESRALRVRKHLRGNAAKPRLCVVKTNAHIHAQLIDDENGITIVSVSTLDKAVKGTGLMRRNKTSAKKLGERLGEIAKEKNVQEVIFDRGFSKYHGVLAELANAARESGLKF